VLTQPLPRLPQSAGVADRAQTLRPARRALRYRVLLRFGVLPYLVVADLFAGLGAAAVTGLAAVDAAALVTLTLALLAAAGRYRSRLELSLLDDVPTLVGRPLGAGAFVVAGAAVLRPDQAPPTVVLLTAVVLAGGLLVGRALGYTVVRRLRARGAVQHPTLVLGAGHVGGQVARLLVDHPSYGLRPVGFLDASPLLPESERVAPVLGGPDALASAILEFDIGAVVVAFSALPESQVVDVIRTCDRLSVEIFTVPRLYELHRRGPGADEVWGLPLVRMRRAAFRSPTWRLKRVLDVVVSGAALALLSPLLALVAVALRLDGGPGVLFRQERVGLDGRPFTVLKFRSMWPADEQESQQTWSIAGDARVTRLGALLRSSSVDELPQLWNVLRGDMTLVGPRPERPHFVERFATIYPRYGARHRVPAGLTGWAQVHGLRGDTSIDDRARFDNYYIENWSLWYDVTIMLRTVGAVLRRTGS
jgi:exopolysaccharide biosynthesis polyprenyl glycosylphosphotransferase